MGVFTEMPTFGLYPWGKPQNGFGINGPLRLFGTPAVLTADADLTLTMAQLLAGYILRDPISDDRDDVLPTATLMVQGLGPGVTIGSFFDFAIKNTGAGVEDIDLNAGAGVTLNPTVVEIAPGQTGLFRAVVTGVSTPTVTVYSIGIIDVPVGTAYKTVEIVTDDRVITAADHGTIFMIGTDAKTFTLPATIAGIELTFINIGAAGNNILTISPVIADGVFGNLAASHGANADATTADGLVSQASGAANKDWVNTKTTANQGDRCTLIGDGVDGWFITAGVGVWASEG